MKRITQLILLLLASPVFCAEVLQHDLEYKDNHFILKLEMRLDASREQVYRVLLDFNNLTQINDSIKKSQLLFSNKNIHTVRTESEGCVLFFCRTVAQTQLINELGDYKLRSITDADESDFTFGDVYWTLKSEGEHTRIVYQADYVPNFWIPPLIGPAIFKSRMLEEAQKSINGIEQRANADQKPTIIHDPDCNN